MITVNQADALLDWVGVPTPCPLQCAVDADKLHAFLAISQDRANIHLQGLQDGPVVPANLLLALLPTMLQSGLQVTGSRHCVTAAYRDVRFQQPVYLNQPLELEFTVTRVKRRGTNCFVTTELTLRCAPNHRAVLTAQQTDCYAD